MVKNFSQEMLNNTKDFQFETFYNKNSNFWYLYSKVFDMYLVVPKDVNEQIEDYAIDEQDIALQKILMQKPSWLFDINSYCDISWQLDKQNYPENFKDKIWDETIDIATICSYNKNIVIIYGTAGMFDVKYKDKNYHSLASLLKENMELNYDNWYETVEYNNGCINSTPNISFIYTYNSSTKDITSLDSEYTTSEEVIENLLAEFNYYRTEVVNI